VGEATKDANITVHINTNQTIIVDGLPVTCVNQIEAYIAHPDTKSHNAQDGTVTILNGTSVQIEGVPKEFINEYIKEHTENAN
jgi:hypothetical protein